MFVNNISPKEKHCLIQFLQSRALKKEKVDSKVFLNIKTLTKLLNKGKVLIMKFYNKKIITLK